MMTPDPVLGQRLPPRRSPGERRPLTTRLLTHPAMPGGLVALLGLVLGLVIYQTPATYRLELAAAGGTVIGGFDQPETTPDGRSFRWTTGEAGVRLPPLGSPGTLRVTATGWRPDGLPSPTLTVLFDGQPIATWRTSNAEMTYEAALPRRWLSLTGNQLLLRSETFVPGPRDRRTLGVAIRQIEISTPSGVAGPVVPPLAALALWSLTPLLLLRALRHLRLPTGPSLALTGVALLAVATPAAADRVGWLMASPAAVLGVAGLAAVAAVGPPLVARALPGLRQTWGAVRLGLLPAWPEWETVTPAELSPGRRRALRLAVAGLAIGLLLLHLLSWLVPVESVHWESNAWGLRYVHRLPLWVPVGLALLIVPLALPAVSQRLWALGERIGERLNGRPSRRRRLNPYYLALLGGGLALPLLWLGRANVGQFGDSSELERKIALEGALWREREPLDFFLHAQLYRLLNPLLGWDVATVYAVLSCLAGGLFVTTLCLLVALLTRRQRDRWLAAALIASAGFVQLFFGYLESYTLMTAGLAVYLLLALLCLAGRIGIGWPATALAVAATLHPIAIAVLPSLGVLLLQRWYQRRFTLMAGLRLLLPTVAGLVIPWLLLVALFLANGYTQERWQIARRQFGGADLRTFKPLVQVTSHLERYPLLSLDHPRALVNQQLLIAPLGWPLALILLLTIRPRGLWRDPRFAFLLLAAASTTAFTALWNPDLGPRNDWDLLSIGALPSMTLAAFLLVTLVPRGTDRRYCGLLLLGANLFHTGLWVASNSQVLAPWLGP